MSATSDYARLAQEKSGNVVRAVAVATGVAALVAVLVAAARWSPVDVPGELVETLVAVLSLLQILAGCLWISWFREVHAATQAAGLARFRARGMWCWGWVVPVASLWLPKMMTNDVVWAPDDGRRPIPWVVQIWWGLWVTAGLVTASPHGPVPGSLAPLVFYVLAGVAACRVVRLLTGRVLLLAAQRDEPDRELAAAG
jgi:hypothetical protein